MWLSVRVADINPKAGEAGFTVDPYNALFKAAWLMGYETFAGAITLLDYILKFLLAESK